MSTICVFHGDCMDGFTAAWVVSKAIPDVVLYKGFHNQPAPDVSGMDVVIVDFSYPQDVMEKIARTAATLTWLDHHKTAVPTMSYIEDLGLETVHIEYDVNRSGAGIAWDHFKGRIPGSDRFDQSPLLVDYVQDRDLWLKRLPHSDAVAAYIASFPYELTDYDNIAADMETNLKKVFGEGKAILRKQKRDMDLILKSNTRRMVIGGHEVKVANVPYSLASDAGNELAKKGVFGATYTDQTNSRKFSLRSIGDFDVSEIAAKYGGGGHKNAAGFHVPLTWEGDPEPILARAHCHE